MVVRGAPPPSGEDVLRPSIGTARLRNAKSASQRRPPSLSSERGAEDRRNKPIVAFASPSRKYQTKPKRPSVSPRRVLRLGEGSRVSLNYQTKPNSIGECSVFFQTADVEIAKQTHWRRSPSGGDQTKPNLSSIHEASRFSGPLSPLGEGVRG